MAGESSDVSSGDQATAAQRNLLRKDALKLWAQGSSELTIATGAITVGTDGFYTVDTESDASTDNLDTINGGIAGEIVLLTPASAARDVVIRHGVGNVVLAGGQNLVLVETDQVIMLRHNGTNWVQVSEGPGRIMVYGGTLGFAGNGPIAAGDYVDIPYLPHHYILGFYARADVSGSVSLDLRITTLADATIDGSDSVGTSPEIVFSSVLTLSDTTLSGWTLEHQAGQLARLVCTVASVTLEQVSVAILALKL